MKPGEVMYGNVLSTESTYDKHLLLLWDTLTSVKSLILKEIV